MKFKSHLITEGSGSIGGLTFSHNRAGMYIRSRTVPTNPNTQRQGVVRTGLSEAQAWWKTMDETGKALWEQYAAATPLRDALGRELKLTGLQMFIRTHVFYAVNGLQNPADAPTEPGLAFLTPPTVSWDEATQKLKVAFDNSDNWATGPMGFLAVFCSRLQSRSRNFWRGPYQLLGTVQGAGTPPTSPVSFQPPQPVYGDLRLFLRFRCADTQARLSAEAFAQVDVTPLA